MYNSSFGDKTGRIKSCYPSQSSVHRFLGLTSTKQDVNVTCSRPQRNVHRPGFEPGTHRSEIQQPNHCATPPPIWTNRDHKRTAGHIHWKLLYCNFTQGECQTAILIVKICDRNLNVVWPQSRNKDLYHIILYCKYNQKTGPKITLEYE